jgi:hypothetical protein
MDGKAFSQPMSLYVPLRKRTLQAAVCASGRRISLRSVERHWPAVREALLAAA